MRVRTAASVFATAMAGLLLAAVPGSAAETKAVPPQNLRLSVTPKSGPAGTLVTIKSVDPCPALGGHPSQFADVSIAYFTESDAIPTQSLQAVVAADGRWSAKLPLPSNQTGPAHVAALCSRPGVQAHALYPDVRFDVTTRGTGFWLLSASAISYQGDCFCLITSNMLGAGDAHD